MNRRIRRMLEELERRGALVHISEDVPDQINEQFLREVLACPCCREGAESPIVTPFDPARTPIDRLLAGLVIPRKRGH